jgi:uncharacterized membrane protein YphA (DoxX/SURF4 family)
MVLVPSGLAWELFFFWFGSLKFIPGLSPAQDLATRTMEVLSFGLIKPYISIVLLAIWECLIGIGLLFGIFIRATLLLLFVQMLGTIMPIIFFPQEVFSQNIQRNNPIDLVCEEIIL